MKPVAEGISGAGNAGRDGETGSAGILQVSAGNARNSPRALGQVQPKMLEDDVKCPLFGDILAC